MRWLAIPLTLGCANAAGAGDLNFERMRGSTGSEPSYVVIQAPAQADASRELPPDYPAVPSPLREPRVAPASLAPKPTVLDRTGPYVGITAGGASGSYDPTTSTVAGTPAYMNATQAAAVTAAGRQSIRPSGTAAGIEAGYNWQFGRFLLGSEVDLQSLDLNGAANSGAVNYPGASGNQFVVSSYGNSNWLATFRGRAGIVAYDNTMFFVTGGLALTRIESNFLFTDNVAALESAKINSTKTGYVVGAGFETPLSDRLSLKAEYQYVNFGRSTATVTGNTLEPFFTNQVFTHTGDFSANILRLGLNYRLGDGYRLPGVAAIPLQATSPLNAWPLERSGWEVEAGARTWFSSGRIGAPQPLLNSPETLASRLTFTGLDAASGEVFARADHVGGLFLKGSLGAGGIGRGQLNDEDFPAAGAYSNTLSIASGHIAYGTADLGYAFLRTPGAKVGPFIGYSYSEEDINTFGCTQLAGAATCVAAAPFPANFLGISQDGHYDSLRLGLSSQFMLTDRLRLTADVAYLPVVNYTGLDSHNARELLLPETASKGDGVMLEAILGYDVTDTWNLGLGGRYWAWNTNTGTSTFNFLGYSPGVVEPARYTSERYGVFLQSSYRWGGTTPAAAPVLPVERPMNWTGFYAGGHLGGGWSDDRWADGFGSAPSGLGAINIAGFGDSTHATGPLAGGQVGFDLQSGHAVFGVQADASLADLRGENTCFSGLGGVNCQRAINAIGTVTGRAGYAWDRALVYAKAGGALTNVTYSLNGNTNAVALGTGSSSGTAAGWTAGAGVEYALTDCWSTMLEYDYVDLSSTAVVFPTVAVLNAKSTTVQQSINAAKLGLNYRFNIGPVVAKY